MVLYVCTNICRVSQHALQIHIHICIRPEGQAWQILSAKCGFFFVYLLTGFSLERAPWFMVYIYIRKYYYFFLTLIHSQQNRGPPPRFENGQLQVILCPAPAPIYIYIKVAIMILFPG